MRGQHPGTVAASAERKGGYMTTMVAEIVYLLCTGTSLLCAALLLRAYAAQRLVMLLFSGICFLGLALNNLLLYLDFVIPHTHWTLARNITAAIATIILLIGLIWNPS
jgi:hypothetical protein